MIYLAWADGVTELWSHARRVHPNSSKISDACVPEASKLDGVWTWWEIAFIHEITIKIWYEFTIMYEITKICTDTDTIHWRFPPFPLASQFNRCPCWLPRHTWQYCPSLPSTYFLTFELPIWQPPLLTLTTVTYLVHWCFHLPRSRTPGLPSLRRNSPCDCPGKHSCSSGWEVIHTYHNGCHRSSVVQPGDHSTSSPENNNDKW